MPVERASVERVDHHPQRWGRWITAAIVGLLLCVSIPAMAQTFDEDAAAATVLRRQGDQRREAGELEAALTLYQEAARLAPDDLSSQYKLAWTAAELGERGIGLAAIGQCLRLEPELQDDAELTELRQRLEASPTDAADAAVETAAPWGAEQAVALRTAQKLLQDAARTDDADERDQLFDRICDQLDVLFAGPEPHRMEVWRTTAAFAAIVESDLLAAACVEAIERRWPDYYEDPRILNTVAELKTQGIDDDLEIIRAARRESGLAWVFGTPRALLEMALQLADSAAPDAVTKVARAEALARVARQMATAGELERSMEVFKKALAAAAGDVHALLAVNRQLEEVPGRQALSLDALSLAREAADAEEDGASRVYARLEVAKALHNRGRKRDAGTVVLNARDDIAAVTPADQRPVLLHRFAEAVYGIGFETEALDAVAESAELLPPSSIGTGGVVTTQQIFRDGYIAEIAISMARFGAFEKALQLADSMPAHLQSSKDRAKAGIAAQLVKRGLDGREVFGDIQDVSERAMALIEVARIHYAAGDEKWRDVLQKAESQTDAIEDDSVRWWKQEEIVEVLLDAGEVNDAHIIAERIYRESNRMSALRLVLLEQARNGNIRLATANARWLDPDSLLRFVSGECALERAGHADTFAALRWFARRSSGNIRAAELLGELAVARATLPKQQHEQLGDDVEAP